jgi:N-acetylglucosamine-6-phosphate deacetylase
VPGSVCYQFVECAGFNCSQPYATSTEHHLRFAKSTSYVTQVPKSCTKLDAVGSYVMPGGIDPHTHLSMPFMGTITVDDFYR